MLILVHRPTGETVATFGDRGRADDFVSALRVPSDYQLFQEADTTPRHLLNRESIINDLRYIAQTKKISAIKLYRSIYGVGLTEAKNVIEGCFPTY